MITVLTSTLNRSHTLPRLFESLCNQGYKHFEWVVVDGGSTDDSLALLAEFKEFASFPVRVIHKPKSGKNGAINAGVLAATGDWVFIVDSDDALTPDAIATIEEKLRQFNSDKMVGLYFRRAYFNGKIIGKILEDNVLRLTPAEAADMLKGDLAYVFKRDSLLRNQFPVISGEKFVPELYVWNKIGDQGDIHFFLNKYIYFCEYLPDGLSINFSTNLKRNPRGFLLFYRSQIMREAKNMNKIKCTIRVVQCYFYILLKMVE